MASNRRGDPAQLADRALALAESFLTSATGEIVDLSNGDTGALFEASQILRAQSSEPNPRHSAEHLAFSLIAAAHNELRTNAEAENA